MIVDIVSDSSNRCGHVPERAPTDAFDANLAEPTLDQDQPGTGCGNKVQMEPWMPNLCQGRCRRYQARPADTGTGNPWF